MILGHSYIKLSFRIEKVNVIRKKPIIKGKQAQMALNRMMNLSSAHELPFATSFPRVRRYRPG